MGGVKRGKEEKRKGRKEDREIKVDMEEGKREEREEKKEGW